MKRWVLYLTRMFLFVTIWLLVMSFIDDAPPMDKLPQGVLSWLLFEIFTSMWGRFVGNSSKHDGK